MNLLYEWQFCDPKFVICRKHVEGIDDNDPGMTMIKTMTRSFGDKYLAYALVLVCANTESTVTIAELQQSQIKYWMKLKFITRFVKAWTCLDDLKCLPQRKISIFGTYVLQHGVVLIQQRINYAELYEAS